MSRKEIELAVKEEGASAPFVLDGQDLSALNAALDSVPKMMTEAGIQRDDPLYPIIDTLTQVAAAITAFMEHEGSRKRDRWWIDVMACGIVAGTLVWSGAVVYSMGWHHALNSKQEGVAQMLMPEGAR